MSGDGPSRHLTTHARPTPRLLIGKLKAQGKGTHFLRSLKEPIQPDSNEAGRTMTSPSFRVQCELSDRRESRPERLITSWYEPGAQRLIDQSNGPGSQCASVTTAQARQLGSRNADRPSMPRTIARTILAVGSPRGSSASRGRLVAQMQPGEIRFASGPDRPPRPERRFRAVRSAGS